MTASAIGVTRRDDCDGRTGSGRGGGLFRTVFAELLETIWIRAAAEKCEDRSWAC